MNKKEESSENIVPKFKVGQTIRCKGFNHGFTIANIENGFYYNAVGDYFPFEGQDDWEVVKPKFKVGDKVNLKGRRNDKWHILTITRVNTEQLYYMCDQETIIDFDEQDEWKLVESADKKDFRDRYKRIAQSEEFKVSHKGMSIGEVIPVEGESNTYDDFTKALAECISQAKCSVTDPLAHAGVWRDELVKLARHEVVPTVDMEEAADDYATDVVNKYTKFGMMDTASFDGYFLMDAFKAGAEWQKEELMREYPVWTKVAQADNSPKDSWLVGMDDFLYHNGYKINICDLWKLPKEE